MNPMTPLPHSRRRMFALAAALLVAVVAVHAPAQATAAPPSGKPLPWSSCYQEIGAEFGVRYECAQLKVPLDHDQPAGAKVQLAVVRLPATDQDSKIGSILLNPGGPGGSGVEFALFFGPFAEFIWGPQIRERFDIVGFDPRGVVRSSPLKCFGNERQAVRALTPFAFPLTPEEEEQWIAGDELLAEQCDRRGNRIGEHMSTANVARDMDLLREAVGDEQLTYVGGSYGSYLGVTYANLFPQRVRAVVVDAVLDPVAWANVEGEIPFSTRVRSAEGARDTLDRAFELCEQAGPEHCALAPNAAQRFDDLAQALRAEPVEFTDPETGEQVRITYQDLIATTLILLYDPFAYPDLAAMVAGLESAAFSAAVPSADREHAARFVTKRGFPRYRNFVENLPAVACSDSNNPTDYDVWSDQGAAADAEFGYFGRIWTWTSGPCAVWPLTDEDRYTGPYDAQTANPVLVASTLYDPATPYHGAQAVREMLPNSALLSVDMPGHGTLGISGCAGFLTGRYLVDPSIAPAIDGTLCPQEFNPFETGGDAEAASGPGMAPKVRTELLKHAGYRPRD